MLHLAFAAALALSACRRAPEPRRFSGEIQFEAGKHFAVASDLQHEEENERARELIVAEIAVRRPSFLVITGDMVREGWEPGQWVDFDRLCEPLHQAQIPVLAAIGNHDYAGVAQSNLDGFFARFPHLERRHWYSITYGPLAVVVLDSNEQKLSTPEWEAQKSWFERTLGELDGDARMRGALVLLHHPPYTNSTVTGDETQVQEAFVGGFLHSLKALAMISGHVHSYERFARGGKMFVVSGGGGPRAVLAVGSDRRHPDDQFAGPEWRDYGFLDINVTSTGLEVQAIRITPEAPPSAMDTFVLPWASAETVRQTGAGQRE